MDPTGPMDWSRLLCDERLGELEHREAFPVRTAFQTDADRITFSGAFRRLQGKAQVYPLPDDDHVHTRLTHSLEVASAGRSIGNLVGSELLRRRPELSRRLDFRDLGDCVHAACLAHDLGNPPFGHSGEDAIRTWFQGWASRDPRASALRPRELRDLCGFEGNAQGLRVLTSLEMGRRAGGLRLTAATLGAFTKYPRAALPDGERPEGKGLAKLGVYQAELPLFRALAQMLGLIPRPGLPDAWCRHPLAFLVEAADDICYLILDLEDGHRLGYVSHALIQELLLPIASRDSKFRPHRPSPKTVEEERAFAGRLRALSINVLVQQAAAAFLASEEAILSGTFDRPLTSLMPSRTELRRIEVESVRTCYQAREVVTIEVAGFEVIAGLLDKLVSALLEPDRPLSRQLRQRFPWLGSDGALYPDLLRITDYIAGMTDHYAVDLYRAFFGLRLPSRR